MASNVSQMAFDSLDAPVAVVGARNWITPAAEMEDSFFPQKEWILDTIHETGAASARARGEHEPERRGDAEAQQERGEL